MSCVFYLSRDAFAFSIYAYISALLEEGGYYPKGCLKEKCEFVGR